MTFKELCIQDNKLTPAGEKACEIVYEKLTGKCWHEKGEWAFDALHCAKCEATIRHDFKMPNLAFSLDAWRPIWEGMYSDTKVNHSISLNRIATGHVYVWLTEPIHHLEAALRALGEYERWLEG